MRAFIAALVIPALSLAYSHNPPNGKTGAPGEGTCADCHASFGLNSGPGTLLIGAPSTFEAGEPLVVTIVVTHPGKRRWGFEFSPLDVGTCAVIDPQTLIVETVDNRTYVKQTRVGTFEGLPDGAAWAFTWTPPPDPPQSVTFWACANAADGNGSTSGDHIYTTHLQLSLAPNSAGMSPKDGPSLLMVSPNPAPGHALVRYVVPRAGPVDLAVYHPNGSLVTRLVHGERPEGTWTVQWQPSRPIPHGVYLCRLRVGGAEHTTPLVVTR